MSSGDTRFINHGTITDFQRGCWSDLEFGRRGLPNLSHDRRLFFFLSFFFFFFFFFYITTKIFVNLVESAAEQ